MEKIILLYIAFSIFIGYFLFDYWPNLKKKPYMVLFWIICGPASLLYSFVNWIFQSLKEKWDQVLVSQILQIYNSIDRSSHRTKVNFYVEDWQYEDEITSFFTVRGICICYKEENGMIKTTLCWHNLDELDKKIERLKGQL